MSGKHNQQTQKDGNDRFGIHHAGQTGQETWEGGGLEPVHPDDIDDDGENLVRHSLKQQYRSDDN